MRPHRRALYKSLVIYIGDPSCHDREKSMTLSKKQHAITRCLSFAFSAIIILLSLCQLAFAWDAFKMPYSTHILGTNMLAYGSLMVALAGALAIALTLTLLFALVKQQYSLLAMVTLLTFGTACLSALAGIIGFFLKQELTGGGLHDWMQDGLRSGYGHSENIAMTNAWDEMQRDLHCCGVVSSEEWSGSDWFLGQVRYPRRRRPQSCCVTCATAHQKFCIGVVGLDLHTSLEAMICQLVVDKCEKMDESPVDLGVCRGVKPIPPGIPNGFIFQEGCLPLFGSRLTFHASVITTSGFSCAVMLYLNAAASFLLFYAMSPSQSYDAVQTSI